MNLDNFLKWKSGSQKVRDIKEKREEELKWRDKLNKESIKKGKSSSRKSTLITYDELYTSRKIYEDMAIFIIDKFLEYQKKTTRSSRKNRITLISPFNKEVNYLSKQLEKKDIEVLTIDKSQGIDRDLVTVLCTTRGLKANDLLENWKRVNVACTRAKSKLVLVGSGEKLSEIPVMERFLGLIRENDWMYEFDLDMMESD